MKGIHFRLYLMLSLSSADFQRKIHKYSWDYCETGWQGNWLQGHVMLVYPNPTHHDNNITVSCSVDAIGSKNKLPGLPSFDAIELITLWRHNHHDQWEYIASYWPNGKYDIGQRADGNEIKTAEQREKYSQHYNDSLIPHYELGNRYGNHTGREKYNLTFSGAWPKTGNAKRIKIEFEIFSLTCDWVVPYKCVFYFRTKKGHKCYTFHSTPVIHPTIPDNGGVFVSRKAANYPIGAKIKFTCKFYGDLNTTLVWEVAWCKSPNSFVPSDNKPRVREIQDQQACSKMVISELDYVIREAFCRFRCVVKDHVVLKPTKDLTIRPYRPLMRMTVSPDADKYFDGQRVRFTCTLKDPPRLPLWNLRDPIVWKIARCDSPDVFINDHHHKAYEVNDDSGCYVGHIYELNMDISQYCKVVCVDSKNRVSVTKQFTIPDRKEELFEKDGCTLWSGWSDCSPFDDQRRFRSCKVGEFEPLKTRFEERNCNRTHETNSTNSTEPDEPDAKISKEKENYTILLILVISSLIPIVMAVIMYVAYYKFNLCKCLETNYASVESPTPTTIKSFQDNERSSKKPQLTWDLNDGMIIDKSVPLDKSVDYSLLTFYSSETSSSSSRFSEEKASRFSEDKASIFSEGKASRFSEGKASRFSEGKASEGGPSVFSFD